jgi:hypothetical protein
LLHRCEGGDRGTGPAGLRWVSASATGLRRWATHRRKGRPGWAAQEKKNKTKRMEAWAARKMKKTKETLGRMGCFRELSPRGFNYFQNPFFWVKSNSKWIQI